MLRGNIRKWGLAIGDYTVPLLTNGFPRITEPTMGHSKKKMEEVILHVATVPLVAAAGNGGAFAWQNPHGAPIVPVSIDLRITAEVSGQTINIGRVSAGNASGNGYFNAQSIAAQGVFRSSNALVIDAKDGSNDYITGTASGTPTGLAGYVKIVYYIAE